MQNCQDLSNKLGCKQALTRGMNASGTGLGLMMGPREGSRLMPATPSSALDVASTTSACNQQAWSETDAYKLHAEVLIHCHDNNLLRDAMEHSCLAS